jgi:hypothetical protein
MDSFGGIWAVGRDRKIINYNQFLKYISILLTIICYEILEP